MSQPTDPAVEVAKGPLGFLRILGPGLITGAADATTSTASYGVNNHIHDSYATIGTVFSW